MKRIHLTLVLATVLCVAGFAAHANAGPVGTLEFNLGYNKSSNEVTVDGESLGGGVGFGVGYWRSASPQISWGAEVAMENLGNIEASYFDPFIAEDVDEELSAKMFRVTPGLRVNFGSMVGPNFFAQGGAGMYKVSAEYHYQDTSGYSFQQDESNSEFGFNLGAGVGFPVGPKTRMNIQGQYHSVATEGESTNYLAFRAGIGIGL